MSRTLMIFLSAPITLLLACKPEGAVQCIGDESCNAMPGGACLQNVATRSQWCAYPDSSCPSGTRWSDHDVGDNVGGTCVGSGTAVGLDAGIPDARVGDGNVACMPRVAFHDGPYSFQNGGKREVYVSNPDGTGLVNISNAANFDDYRATWSPDGIRVAFQSNRNGNWDIYVAKADGSAIRNLTSGSTAEEEMPVWSPDGTKIAFLRNLTPWYMTSDGLAPTQVSTLTAGNFLRWSPDSQRLAFAHFNPNVPDMYVASISGTGQPVNVSNTPSDPETNASWAPGPKLIFSSSREIYKINPDGTGLENLTNSTDPDYLGLWSPLGEVFFTTGKSGGMPMIWRMTDSGASKTQITMHELIDDFAGDFANDVSSDGQSVAFVRSESLTAAKIGVVSRTGGTPKLFSAGGNNAQGPVFAKCP